MIVKMTRYDFLLYHRDVSTFLDNLRELGLVDITLKDFDANEEQKIAISTVAQHSAVATALKSIKAEGEPFSSADEAVEKYQQAKSRYDEISSEIHALSAEASRVEVWGEFTPSHIEDLKSQGIVLRFFETPSKSYRLEWEHIYAVQVIERHKGHTYFVVASKVEDATASLEINAVEVPAPLRTTTQIEIEIEELIGEQAELQHTIARTALSLNDIKLGALRLTDELNYQKVLNSAQGELEGTLMVLEGWSETSCKDEIEKFADSQEVVYTSQSAQIEHNPPIKLKNNFFARLFEPIGAIYMYPRYNELDLTPFFAPFFMIFFGMCFGDAGYGVLMILATVVLWRKIPKGFKDFGWLVIFLNFAAVVFGIFSGNIFGIELVKLDSLVEFKEFFLNPNDIFYLSIMLGAVQVVFGLLLRTFNRIKREGGFIYGVSNIGWLILIISSVVAFTGVLPEYYSTSSLAYEITLYFALALILFFSVPKKPFASIGKGLYSFYEMSTGIIGDLISYVRLFAIGLAGTIIAQVFNELSIGLSGDIPGLSFIFMAVILLIGHGLNIFISTLGAIVHPIRLTFVEFYKNAEFEGGGRKFTPFKKKVN